MLIDINKFQHKHGMRRVYFWHWVSSLMGAEVNREIYRLRWQGSHCCCISCSLVYPGEQLTSLLPFSHWRGNLWGSTGSSHSLCWRESHPCWGLGEGICQFMVIHEQVLLDIKPRPPTWQPLVIKVMVWLLSSLFILSLRLLRTCMQKRGTLCVET